MLRTDDLYQGFLEEMHSLESFRAAYTNTHEGVPLEREDPEVRRLIEAMAFFTARTRASGMRNIVATRRRLFQQFFSFLLSPLPATGFVQAQISGRFAEPATLPKDATVLVSPEGGQGAVFRTLNDLRILPIRLDAVETLPRSKGGVRVALHFKAAYARNDDLGTLRFLVNHLNDYQASLNVLDTLRRHIKSIHVAYEVKVDDETKGEPCEFSYGAPNDSDGHPHSPHPIQKVRNFLHFPQHELYLNVSPPRPPRNWKKFTIFFDLGAGLPKTLRFNADMFQLFTVPIVNLTASSAQPILCDGTKERYTLRHPDIAKKMTLHSVVGVYELAAKGRVELRPGIISGGSGSYEVEREGDGDHETSYLKLNYPEAFAEPKKIVVDALWLQPWLSEKLSGRLSASLHDRNISGLEFELQGDIRPHAGNTLQRDPEGLLHVLAMKSKAQLDQDDVMLLLNALGALGNSAYKKIPALVQELKVSAVPLPREQGGGLRRIYRLRMREFDPATRAMVETYLTQLGHLLNAWTPDGNVAIEAVFAGSEDVIRI